nr:cyclophilin-like fold protein [uncultured Desulfobacter sp.]
MKRLFLFSAAALMSICFVINCTAQSFKDNVKITLTIGNKIVPAILYNTPPAKNLMGKLPVTVSLNRGPVDYCGGIEPVVYSEKDLQAGYHRGDLAYWIPGQDFVIFTENKKDASGSPDLVILGKVSSDIKELRDLGSTINVTITLDR